MSPPISRMRATVCVLGILTELILSDLEGFIKVTIRMENQDAVSLILSSIPSAPIHPLHHVERTGQDGNHRALSKCFRYYTQPEPRELVRKLRGVHTTWEQYWSDVDSPSIGPLKLGLAGAGDNIQETHNREWLRQ